MDFEDIRSYHDVEVHNVVMEMLNDEGFSALLSKLYGEEKTPAIRQILSSCKSKFDLQDSLVKPFVAKVIADSMASFTVSGYENVPRDRACLFISNHRNIILDSALLSWYLHTHGLSTVEIAIGSNLLYFPWIEKLVKLNKSFIIRRGIAGRALLQSSMQASAYIKHKIVNDHQSIWIAQREGRAKDGNDLTQASLIHMLLLAAENKQFADHIQSLSIIPSSVSYEFDPCDIFKAQEFAAKEKKVDNFEKSVSAYNEMAFEVMWPKGKVHYHFGKPLDVSSLADIKDKAILSESIASLIDKEIHGGLRIEQINKSAAAYLGELDSSEQVSKDEIEKFKQYVLGKAQKFGLDPDLTLRYTAKQYAQILKNWQKENA